MALIKTEGQREVEALARIERQIERRERRERVHRILIVVLSLLAVGAFVSGHLTGRNCRHHRR